MEYECTRRDQQAEGKAVNAFGATFFCQSLFLPFFACCGFEIHRCRIRVLCLGASLRLLRRIDYE